MAGRGFPNLLKQENRFAKPDIERLGLFREETALLGKYLEQPLNVHKGPTIVTSGPKIKDGTSYGYFDKDLKRIFVGEAIKGRGRKPKPQPKNITTKAFMPGDGSKLHSTPGDYYGTFGKYPYFSALLKKDKKPKVPDGKNFVTRNPKKGGPGYVDITIAPYPTRIEKKIKQKKSKDYGQILNGPMRTSNYPKAYFDPNPYQDPEKMKGSQYVRPKIQPSKIRPPGYWAQLGPNKLEGKEYFSPFTMLKEKYLNQYESDKLLEKKFRKPYRAGPWIPQSWTEKSMYTASVISSNMFKINLHNYSQVKPLYIKYLTCSKTW